MISILLSLVYFSTPNFFYFRKSEFFQKLFHGGFAEDGRREVTVSDPTGCLGPSPSFYCCRFLPLTDFVFTEAVIKYAYTGVVEVNASNVSGLLDAADLFAVEGLAVEVIDQVQSQLDEDLVRE